MTFFDELKAAAHAEWVTYTEHPFTNAMADGVVSSQELKAQEDRLTAALKTLEGQLSDEAHAQVTTVLVELSAYNVMRVLHELQSQHARMVFDGA